MRWYSHLLGIGNGTEDASNVAATDRAVYVSISPRPRWGGRLYAAATTLVGGEPVTVMDQLALGATAAG